MTLTNSRPRTFKFALILFILLVFPFQTTVFGKKRQSNKRSASRTEKSKKLSAKQRRGGRRNERVSKQSRRGGKSQLSRRELRRESAREQAASLKALERRLRRPLTKRERAAALRGNSRQRRREILAARRRAEAARRAAIARQRAIEKAMRDEAQTFIGRDDTTGEDLEVRRVAVNALGYHAGTVVVMDPQSGKIYSVVNQEWALRRGFKPCSTIKLVTGVAGLEEKMISPFETTNISDKYKLDLTDALAYSNNTYFQHIGGQVGFEKMMGYAKELGLGEKTGVNVPNEYSGRLPLEKSGFALNRMSSHGDDFEVTALQLGTLVSALANGGKLLVPYVPHNAEEAKSKIKVRRQLDVSQENLRRMVPGMVGAVNYGSGKKAYDPQQTVAGKTGTCIGQGSWLGLFTSYAPLANPRLAVVVIGRGPDARNHFPAAVAGKIYRELGSRFGAPITLQVATGNPSSDSKAAELNEEDKDAAEAEAAETEAAEAAANVDESAETTAGTQTDVSKPVVKPTAAPRDSVKRVLMPVEPRTNPIQKPETKSGVTKTSGKTPPQPDDRPRKTQP